jgi:hypothetical protein
MRGTLHRVLNIDRSMFLLVVLEQKFGLDVLDSNIILYCIGTILNSANYWIDYVTTERISVKHSGGARSLPNR